MALTVKALFLCFRISLLSAQYLADTATCRDCTRSQLRHAPASYYLNSAEGVGSCGYGSFGSTINSRDVSAASNLYRDGLGCGACYQVRCTNSNYCSDKGVIVVITEQGPTDQNDFILSSQTFVTMARTKEFL